MKTTLFINASACLASTALLATLIPVSAGDWPQYRGPNQDGKSSETINADWGAAGPKTVWKIPTKNGFSSFAVSGGKAYTQVNREINGGPREIVVALDAATGKELWLADVGSGKYDGGGDAGTPKTAAATGRAPRPP